jgi:hypothetical protein
MFFEWPMPLFLMYANTQTMHVKPTEQKSIAIFSYTLAGFEPGSSVPEAEAMSTAPHRQANLVVVLGILQVD